MIDGRRVKEMLNERAEAVCRELLPAGKRVRHEWCCGDIHGAAGQSLRVCLEGSKVGVWCDFQDTGVKGSNLLDLWMRVKGLEFKDAIGEAKGFLGIKDDWQRAGWGRRATLAREERQGQKGTEAPIAEQFRVVKEGGRVWKWLTGERKLPAAAIRAYGLGESLDGTCVVFPFCDADGTVVMAKWRNIEDKKRTWTKPAGAPKMLFGMQAIPATATEVFVTEGELDAVALWAYGQPAVSLPYGAQVDKEGNLNPSHKEWIERDYDWMEKFVNVFLALDMDAPGRAAARGLVPRLGMHRCRMLSFPDGCKDANECLSNGVEVDAIWQAVMSAPDMDPDELKHPSDFRKEVWDRFYPHDGKEPGVAAPWGDNFPMRFRPGEVTAWQGYNGHGKTVGLQFCLCHFAANGQRCCTASLEIPGALTIQNVMRQVLAKGKPESEREMDEALAWMDRWFFVYDHLGSVDSEALLRCFEYAARKYGVQHFVVDSLLKLSDVKQDDFDTQRTMMNRLNAFAAEFQVHVHLVCHSKKPDSKHPEERCWPDKYAIKGSGDIPDLAWNVICMYRNLKKSTAMEEAYQVLSGIELEEKLEALAGEQDALFIVQKQRMTGDMPIRRLWFDAGAEGSWQYRIEPRRSVRRFMEGE